MEKQLIDFETAKLAYEKGFKIHQSDYFNNKSLNVKDLYCYQRPTQSFLQKWLREIHNIHVYPILSYTNNQKYTIELRYNFNKIKTSQTGLTEKPYYNTYEEALKNGLFEALKLI